MSNVTARDFNRVSNSFVGVMLHYASHTTKKVKDPVTLEVTEEDVVNHTAIVFSGEDFELADLTEDTIFSAWKKVVNIFWTVTEKEKELRAINGGIKSKLKAAAPAEVIFTNSSRSLTKSIDVASTVWSRIGLVPTKKDLEDAETKTRREWKSNIHNIAKASFDAMNFRPQIAEQKVETPVVEQTPVEQPVEQTPVEQTPVEAPSLLDQPQPRRTRRARRAS